MIKFLLLGCGRIAQRHAEHIVKYGQLLAVCDIDLDKAKLLAEKYSCLSFSSLEEMLQVMKAQANVVSICTPNGLHASHAVMSLKNGFDVLCEKPMGLTVRECGDMLNTAEKFNRRIFCIKQNRFNPPVKALKEALNNNLLGDIFSVQLNCFWNRNEDYYKNSWKGTRELDGGTLFTQFSHFIDLLYWLIGDVKSVQGIGRNFNHKDIIEFEDTGIVLLEFENGAIGSINYTVNSYAKNMEGSITIFGSRGTVKVGGQYLNELEYQCIEGFEFKDIPEGNKPNNYGNYMGSMSNHDLVYENVVQVLENGASISTSAFEGLKTVDIIERIYKSF